MRKRGKWIVAAALFLLVLPACARKSSDALQRAQTAVRSAEAAGAPEGAPELYQSALGHLAKGRQEDFYFRWAKAQKEYNAAYDNAQQALIKISAAGKAAPPTPPSPPSPSAPETRPAAPPRAGAGKITPPPPPIPAVPETRPAPPSPPARSCQSELDRLTSRLMELEKNAGRRKVRYIYKECPREAAETPAPPGGANQFFIGALSLETPPALEKGRTAYEVKVRYQKAQLGEPSADDNLLASYVLRLHGEVEEPSAVHFAGETADISLVENNHGVWSMPVWVPEGTPRPVKFVVKASLLNQRTQKELVMKFPVEMLDRTACPQCPKCPEAKPAPPPPPPPSSGADWTMRLVFLAGGLVIGLVLGLMFGRLLKRSGGPTIKVGE